MEDKTNQPKLNSMDNVKISIASAEIIKFWSYGEVKKPETINYRTLKPERGGLFCAQIFGPIQDDTCLCEKYKRPKYRGLICEKCGVEVTSAKVRRERIGHINLHAPVAHIWFLKSNPSKIGTLLNINVKHLGSVLAFENDLVINPGTTNLHRGQLLNFVDSQHYRAQADTSGVVIGSGAEALKTMLQQLDLKEEAKSIEADLKACKSESKKALLLKRLKIIEMFSTSGNKPSWMIIDTLAVLPPDLRPLVALEGGRFASSDLNDLYKRIINRNNRLKKLIELQAPEIILRNEKRMLQEAVDSLLDNQKAERIMVAYNKRPFKSLTDNIKGKQGRFRQNLLGKRVDYSGRSVITVGPSLKITECGIPKKMALELFRPFIYHRLYCRGLALTMHAAKRIIEENHKVIWDILEEIVQDYPVLLNRAPTLHRLGFQAFYPKLIEGKAIQIHPLVCTPFNADFDGDSMAVHIPLSIEARTEAKMLMLSSNNIFNPASGAAIVNASQDIIMGLYYASLVSQKAHGAGKSFNNHDSVKLAYDCGDLHLHAPIKCKIDNMWVETTTGRVLLARLLPKDLPFTLINKILKKSTANLVITECFHLLGRDSTIQLLNQLTTAGFNFATQSGISIGIKDMVVPDNKDQLIIEAQQEVDIMHLKQQKGLISLEERYNKTINLWQQVSDNLAKAATQAIAFDATTSTEINSLFLMLDSGARGSVAQLRQLAGMRGLMSKPNGAIIETPITANFREGLNCLEYFTSTHGARKGLADKALSTASSGYLTRRLVDVAQDVVIREDDCLTTDGMIMTSLVSYDSIAIPLVKRLNGRATCEDIILSATTIPAGTVLNVDQAEAISQQQHQVKVRSPVFCKAVRGICRKCYGYDLSSHTLAVIGDPVGVIAAQSIGEPGTQLTLRTFHTGGAVSSHYAAITQNVASSLKGQVKLARIKTVIDPYGNRIVVSSYGHVTVAQIGNDFKQDHRVKYGAILHVEDGQEVEIGTELFTPNPRNIIINEHNGYVKFNNVENNPDIEQKLDSVTGLKQYTCKRNKIDTPAVIEIINNDVIVGSYVIPQFFTCYLQAGAEIMPGEIVAALIHATRNQEVKLQDIVGGLPKVISLFEARRPKNPASMSHVDGVIEQVNTYKNKTIIMIKDAKHPDKLIELAVPYNPSVHLQPGDLICKGDILNEGDTDLHELLQIHGFAYTAQYLLEQLQLTLQNHGVYVNDKHFEIIIKKMLSKGVVLESNDPKFIAGDLHDIQRLEELNNSKIAAKQPVIVYSRVLTSITRVSMMQDSFLAAASFQDTSKVLTDAALRSDIDPLQGLKENVILGRLIPAGTGEPKVIAEAKRLIQEEK